MVKAVALGLTVTMAAAAFAGCGDGNGGDNKKDTKPEKLKFDFGIDKSYTKDDWTPVTVNKKNSTDQKGYFYTKEKGYGFLGKNDLKGKQESKMDPNGEDELAQEIYSDYVIADGETFVVDVAEGYYTVQIVVATKSDSTTTITVENVETPAMGTAGKYTITTLENLKVTDGQMTFKISGSGTMGGLVNAIAISQVDAPKNLTGSFDFATPKVELKWEAAKGAESYNVYRTDETGAVKVFEKIKETTFTDKEVEIRHTYSYYVTGTVDTGAESAPTDSVEYKIIDSNVKVPAVPANLKVSEISDNLTTIVWDKVEGADEYAVYWSDKMGVEGSLQGYKLLFETNDTKATYEASTFNSRYYKVLAGNDGGYSDYALVKADSGMDLTIQLEYLDRNAVALKTEKGVYVGWKLAIDEYADGREFELYRDGALVKSFTSEEATNYVDADGKETSKYVIKAVKDGKIINETENIVVNPQDYYEIPLDIPQPEEKLPDGSSYTYSASDTSVGDVDGDGIYEYFVKWDPSNSKDNSHSGYTGPVIIDCYTLSGEKLWRINLGRNIRAGAHYTQMSVFDFDGDGKSELIVKTADGTVDGTGKVIGDANADYRNSGGYVLEGPEYLTLFEGATGKALDTIDYNPPRGSVGSWGDDYGNRVDRFLACVAYLDGETPSAVICRGYYTRAVLTAYNVENGKLVQKWVCDSKDKGKGALAGQGAHYAMAADVDQDGFDEIVYGSATIDHDGSLLYTLAGANNGAGGGHGDAIHVGDFDLSNPGLEIFMVHESYPNDAGIEMHDAATGKYLFSLKTNTDVGRGMAADIDPNYPGAECWATGTDAWNAKVGYMLSEGGEVITNTIPVANFSIWWDGDLGREILDHQFSQSVGAGVPLIQKWNADTKIATTIKKFEGTFSNNYTKGNVCIQADVIGDWREEVVARTKDNKFLRIYTTTDLSEDRIYTLMHDKQYRVQTASQNVAYNQPPNPSFYLGFDKELMELPIRAFEYAG